MSMKNKSILRLLFFSLFLFFIPLTGLKAKAADTIIYVGEQVVLTDYNYDNGTWYYKTWSSMNSSIASAYSLNGSKNCIVTGRNPGRTTIICHTQATSIGGSFDTARKEYPVAVYPVLEGVSHTNNMVLSVGQTDTINTQPYPSDSKFKKLTFKSSNPSVAKVNAYTGQVTAQSLGTCTVTLTINDTYRMTCQVTVSKDVESISFDPSSLTMNIGDTKHLNVSAVPTDASPAIFSWESSDPSVVSVDKNGLLTAKKAGRAVIEATSWNAKKASCTITVTAPSSGNDVSSPGNGSSSDNNGSSSTGSRPSSSSPTLTLSKKSLSVSIGSKNVLTAKYNGKKVAPKYTTSNKKVATVSQSGRITAKSCGTVKIKASYKGKSVTCTVKVVPKKMTSLKASSKNKAVTLKWKKLNNVTGYKIYRAKSASGKYTAVKTLKASKQSLTLKKQKKGTYYFKIRAYKRVKGKTYYAPLSKAVRIIVK